MQAQTHGAKKYPTSELLASSSERGWSALSAELRSHPAGETPIAVPRAVELCMAVVGNDNSVVVRTGAGQRQENVPQTGLMCLSPIDISDIRNFISATIPRALHLYLPATQFKKLADDFNLPAAPAHSIQFAGGIHDPVMYHLGLAVLDEMQNESAAGRMFVETASATLAARLIQSYCDSGACRALEPDKHHIDAIRLRRVLDYIADNLEADITLDHLAGVAGLSVFHFTRMFSRTTGVPPSRYVSRLRLEQAMADICLGKLSLVEIALKAGFSSQASFTRAFHRTTGLTPGEYRAQRR